MKNPLADLLCAAKAKCTILQLFFRHGEVKENAAEGNGGESAKLTRDNGGFAGLSLVLAKIPLRTQGQLRHASGCVLFGT